MVMTLLQLGSQPIRGTHSSHCNLLTCIKSEESAKRRKGQGRELTFGKCLLSVGIVQRRQKTYDTHTYIYIVYVHADMCIPYAAARDHHSSPGVYIVFPYFTNQEMGSKGLTVWSQISLRVIADFHTCPPFCLGLCVCILVAVSVTQLIGLLQCHKVPLKLLLPSFLLSWRALLGQN